MRGSVFFCIPARVLLGMSTILLLILGGCTSLNVVETWHKTAAAGSYKKILILGISQDQTKRNRFEDVVVDVLTQRFATALASHTLLADLDKMTREEVVAAVRTAGCDAVLTTRVISIGGSKVTQSGSGSGNYVYGAAPMAAHSDFLKATLQLGMYDAKTEELVWSATVKTIEANREVKVSREIGKFIFEELRRDGLI